MSQQDLFAGLDVSTQSCKIVVIDLRERAVLHVDSVNYDNDLPHYGTREGAVADPEEGTSESDPRMWIEAVELLFHRMRESGIELRRIGCMSVSGQQHGLVALDGDGNLARPLSKLWNDFSTADECRLLTERVGGPGRMIEEIGNTQRPGYTAPKIFHMVRHEPETYERTATLFLVHNYINWYLTGGVITMEPGDTSGMALWSPVSRDWSRKVVEAIDPGLLRKLPPVKPSDGTIGTAGTSLVEAFGFSPDCRIDAGSGDNMYGAVGTGNFVPGIVTVSLGTSGTAYTFLEEPYVDPAGEIAAFCDSTGHHLPLLCVSNMSNGYTAILDQFGLSHRDFDSIIRETGPGNGGRILVPWYEGERTPDLPNATPVYFGFGPGDFNVRVLCRAVLEGHVLNLWNGFSRMPVEPVEIRLTGGLAGSPSWRQMIADVFGAETVPVKGEGAALGAAIHAAWVWSKESGSGLSLGEIAEPFVAPEEKERKKPSPEHAEVYGVVRRLFRAVSERARGLECEDPFALRTELLRLL